MAESEKITRAENRHCGQAASREGDRKGGRKSQLGWKLQSKLRFTSVRAEGVPLGFLPPRTGWAAGGPRGIRHLVPNSWASPARKANAGLSSDPPPNTHSPTPQPGSRPVDLTQSSSTQSLALGHQTYHPGRAPVEQQQVRGTTTLRPSTRKIRYQPRIPAPAHPPADALLPAPSPPRGPTRGLTYACLRAMSRCMGVAILARLSTAARGFGKLLGRGGDFDPGVRLRGRSQ